MSYESQVTKLRKQKIPIPSDLREKANEEARLRRRKRKLNYQVKIVLPAWWVVNLDFKHVQTIYPLGKYEKP